MGYGFKEIYDLSPLSIKNLNDQLYMLWKKVMGGINMDDISEGESEKIVEKGIASIDIGVGAVSGTNLIQNGRGNFGTEGFLVSASGSLMASSDIILNHNAFTVTGEFYQTDIAITPAEHYCFGCSVDTNGTDVLIAVYGQLMHSASTARDVIVLEETVNTQGYEKQEFVFTAPSGIKSVMVVFNGTGLYKVTDIQLKAGEVFSEWTPHEGEVFARGISISRERVSIATPNVDINILDPDSPDPENPLISMSASSGGFNRIITQTLEMGGYDLARFSDSPLELFVNPMHANASDANDGQSADTPMFTIMGALKKAARISNQMTHIYLASGTDYRENLLISGYQGAMIFDRYGGTVNPVIYGMGSQGVIVDSCTMVAFQNIDFYCFFSGIPDYTDALCEHTALSFRYSNGRVENSRFYCHTAQYGAALELVHANVTLKDYIIHDFQHIMILKHLSRGLAKNGVGEAYQNFIISGAMLFASGNRPRYVTSLYTQLDSGFQYGDAFEGYAVPLTGVQTPYEYTYEAVFSGSWADEMVMMDSASNIRQGEDKDGVIYTGLIGFNLTQMRSDLNGKTVKSAYLRLTRVSDANSVRDIHLWGCEKAAVTGENPQPDSGYDYGVVYTFMGGDRSLEFGISTNIITDLVSTDSGTPNSLMVFNDWYSPVTLLGYDQLSTLKPVLRICV